MKLGNAAWGRTLVMFIVAWLVGVYIYDVMRGNFHPIIGFTVAAISFVANIVARKYAVRHVENANWKFYFWLALPVILFLLVPLVVKIVIYYRSEDDISWWQHMYTLLPFLLKLGVPVAALLWVYFVLGRLRRYEPEPSTATATDTDFEGERK